MNNPYRARPARARVDHGAVTGYGSQNQNTWNSGPPMNVYQPQPNISQQPTQAQDPWDWGGDASNNGNDSWNWSIDPKSEVSQQQQQLQQQHQNQSFSSSHQNTTQNSQSGMYYPNLNSNGRPNTLPQPPTAPHETPRTSLSRESTPNHNDPYIQYPPYDYSQPQQSYHLPPRPNSKPSPALADHPQRPLPHHQPQSLPAARQQTPPQQVQKMQTPPPPIAQPPPQFSNYNWNNGNASVQDWQNHADAPWHEPTPNNQQSGDGVGWQQIPSTPSQSYSSTERKEPTSIRNNQHGQWGSNYPYTDANDAPLPQQNSQINQWEQQPFASREQQPFASREQHEPPSKTWQQPEKHDDWSTPKVENDTIGESRKKSVVDLNNDDWQQVPSSQIGARSSPIQDYNADMNSLDAVHTSLSEHQINSIGNNFSSNVEADRSTEDDWKAVSTSELSKNLSQLNLTSKSNKQVYNQTLQSDMHSSIHSTDGWNSQPLSEIASEHSMVENLPGAKSESHEIFERQIGSAQDIPPTHTVPQTYQADNRAQESLSAPYDQWYEQQDVVENSNWYKKSQQKWTTDQNLENYENIQQPQEFVNSEVVAPMRRKRDIYGSHDSINRETLDNEPKLNNGITELCTPRDFQSEDVNNVEVPSAHLAQQTIRPDQTPDNYEFASNDRNTFLETGELTDSHQVHEPTPPSQDDENDEVPNDIPFLREVPGQSGTSDPRRNVPTGQEQNIQIGTRGMDPRRNDPSGQEHAVPAPRNIVPERTEHRDVQPGQERNVPKPQRTDPDLFERRNDPSGRERSLPPQQNRNDATADNRRNLSETKRNDPSGEECLQTQPTVPIEPTNLREVPGQGNETENTVQQSDSGLREIPGGMSPNDDARVPNDRDRDDARVVTGSQEATPVPPVNIKHEQNNETRSKREEAVGASLREQSGGGPTTRRESYEDGDDEGSGNSRDQSRERHREQSPDRRGYDYERKSRYYDRGGDSDDDYYYDRKRGGEYDRAYNSREDLDRREVPYRDEERRHASRDHLERRTREAEELARRGRPKDDPDDRNRRREDERRKARGDVDTRGRDNRDYDARYFRDREFMERDRRRDGERRGPRYEDYDPRDPYRRDYYDPYSRGSRPSSRSSYNDRDRDYYGRNRADPYYGYNGYGGYDYAANYGTNYYAYLENLRRTNPAAYMEWYHKYYAAQQQQTQAVRGNVSYAEDRASVHSGRSSCDERLFAYPSISFRSPNKALYVSYFGSPGWSKSPLWRHSTTCHSLNRTGVEKRALGDMTLMEDTTIGSVRMTPTKFSTSHVQASFSAGSLIQVHASYPADGEVARVDILRISSLLAHDPIVRELCSYPGPLVKQVGVTHKKTIIEYCESKIRKAEQNEDVDDPASYILLYELMVMLIRQNGNVVGVDIAELLLSNKKAFPYSNKQQPVKVRRESVISQKSIATSGDENNRDTATPLDVDDSGNLVKPLSIEQITDKFRELLLYGCGQEALEYAMTKGLWGHALFLASKLDKRTHSSVMTRFANGLTANDPLQTLYQLQSGRVPASVTCVAEPKWGDWRPHLAMIISNASSNPEVNRKAITTLGDTLMGRGHVHAAHFCYILAQVDFGPYGISTSKLVLLGSNPQRPYDEFVTNESIMLTEIYEYARNLSEPGFTLVDLQSFKFGLAVKMVDYGLTEKALLYVEQIAINIARDPSNYQRAFVERVYNLGDRIKYSDPVCKDSAEDAANLTWLNSLEEIVNKWKVGEITQDGTYEAHGSLEPNIPNHHQQEQYGDQHRHQPQWTTAQPDYSEGPSSMIEQSTSELQSEWQPYSLPGTIHDSYASNGQNQGYPDNPQLSESQNQHQHQQQQQQHDFWGQQNYSQQEYSHQDYSQPEWQRQSDQTQFQNEPTDVDGTSQQEWNYESEKDVQPLTLDPQPTISMAPSTNKQYDPLAELDALDAPKQETKSTAENKKTNDKQPSKRSGGGGGSSWFGGLFSKLAPKPKNQMILPDDSDPSIVWDPVGKKWTNKDADGDGSSEALAPPPKATEMGFRIPSTESAAPSLGTVQPDQQAQSEDVPYANNPYKPPPSGNNMFKMPKGRSLRANYIDVMNPGGPKGLGVATSSTPALATAPTTNVAPTPQFFIPAPVNDPNAPVDFLTPAPAPSVENTQQGLSRWSSASSLSREVQSYTMRDPRLLQQDKGPMMFNPTDVKDATAKKSTRSRYPPR